MVMEFTLAPMAENTTVSFKITKNMDMDFMKRLMVPNTKVNGKMAKNTEKEK